MSSIHPSFDELNDLLDQRGGEERRQIEDHLRGCEACRAEWDRLTQMRAALRRSIEATEEVPESVRKAVAASLDREERSRQRFRRLTRFSVGLAAAALIVWGVILLRRVDVDLPTAAMQDHAAIASGQRPLEVRTSNAAELERWFNSRLDFPSRVFDLAMMRYHLTGGRIDEVDGRRSALFVYRHENGAIVICEMFAGRTETLPAGAEQRVHNNITFFVYDREGVTAVFWQEGAVVCVLAGSLPREEIVSLAFAKAMAVRPQASLGHFSESSSQPLLRPPRLTAGQAAEIANRIDVEPLREQRH